MSNFRNLRLKLERYSKVSIPLLRLLGAWGYARIILIICAGLTAFVLQLAASAILLASLSGRLPYTKYLGQGAFLDLVGTPTPLVTVLIALVMFLIAISLDYFAQIIGVWAGRDFSLAQINRYLGETIENITIVSPNDFSGAHFGSRLPSIPDTKFLMQSQRALDICTRILLVSAPKIFNVFLCIVLLLTLNPLAMLALTPLMMLQITITYRQSILGMRSRVLLEELIPEVVSARRSLLHKFMTANAGEYDLHFELGTVMRSPNENRLAHSFSYQFKILYESNMTTRLMSVFTILTVVIVYRLTLGQDWLNSDTAGWVGLALFIIVLRFASSNIETALRSSVAVNRMFRHLETFVLSDLKQKQSALSEKEKTDVSVDTYTVPTLIGSFEQLPSQGDEDIWAKIHSDALILSQGSRAVLYKTTSPVKAAVQLSRSALRFAPSQTSGASTHSSLAYWRPAPAPKDGHSLSRLLGHESTPISDTVVISMLQAMRVPSPEDNPAVQALQGDFTSEKQKNLSGFSVFLIDLAAAFETGNILLFIELSMLDQIVRDYGTAAQQGLLNLLSDRIAIFYHYRSNEDVLAKTLNATALYEVEGKLAGWGLAGDFVPFENIAKLTVGDLRTPDLEGQMDLIETTIST